MRIRFEPEPARPARPPRQLPEVLEAIRLETGLDLTRARLRLGFSRGHLLELVVQHPEFSSGEDERAVEAAHRLAEGLLGEDHFDTWIGAVDVGPCPRGGSLRVLADGASPPPETWLSPRELLPALLAAVASVDATLPDVPYALADDVPWTLLEGDPGPASDYGAQDDVVTFSTRLPEAMKCFLQGAPFSSRRFSKHGEGFVYVKCDGDGESLEARHELRVALEEALDDALVPARLGCVVGAGFGIRYAYVALSLTPSLEALSLACAALRRAGAPRRSWILRYDSAHDDEWASVWAGAPPPPGCGT